MRGFRDWGVGLIWLGLTASAIADSPTAAGARWHHQGASECDACDLKPGDQFIAAERFASELAAVRHASNRYNPISVREDREFMGVVFQWGESYGYSVTVGEAAADTVTIAVRLPRGAELVAFWHTHGAAHWSRRYFSAVDTQLARDWAVAFYLAGADGLLRVFHPGDRTLTPIESRRLGLGHGTGYARGMVVKEPLSNAVIRIATQK